MPTTAQASASQRESILRLDAADLGYPGHTVLEGVDLDVGRGEFWFLLGPNGCGKTTVLRPLLGLLRPLSGRVWRHPEHAARARLGFVPQHCALSPALPTTVREFVSLGATLGDRPPTELRQDLAWALERAQLEGLAEHDYWSLSGGQRQRALVARALVRRPSLLVLDEPTEGMDVRVLDQFLETLAGLHQGGSTTILFVSHRIEIAVRHATHVGLVHGGHVTQGAAADVLRVELLSAAFGIHGEALGGLLARDGGAGR